jgi:hypothetical protein
MIEAIAVFFCQLGYVFLLGFQSRNVRDGQFLFAACTSGLLGAFGLFMTSAIARSAMLGGSHWLTVAYVAAGPCGVCLAMAFHDKLSARFENNDSSRRLISGEATRDCVRESLHDRCPSGCPSSRCDLERETEESDFESVSTDT